MPVLSLLLLLLLLFIAMDVVFRSSIEDVEEPIPSITDLKDARKVAASVAVIGSTPYSAQSVFVENLVPFLTKLMYTLATREEQMTELRAELEQFESKYSMEVGRLYAELDEIEAGIAEEELRLNPDDEEIKKRAEEARQRAEESAEQLDEENWQACTFKWQPTAEAKKAYHNLARIIHPDLALDTEEKTRRHDLMAKLNDAYSAGDQNLLNKLVEDYRDSPDLIKGDSIGDELVRAIRQIAQVKNRLKELKEEQFKAELSELFILQKKVRNEQIEGRNLLKQMAERTKTHIKKANRRLSNLKQVNEAELADSSERYGINVSAFR